MSELEDKLMGAHRLHLCSHVVDTRDDEEYPATFPEDVEKLIAELEKNEEKPSEPMGEEEDFDPDEGLGYDGMPWELFQ